MRRKSPACNCIWTAGSRKTAAARVVMEEAKKNPQSPFKYDAKFTEIDATTARFDERGIADPLIGSVHDPIYQGAGAMGLQVFSAQAGSGDQGPWRDPVY